MAFIKMYADIARRKDISALSKIVFGVLEMHDNPNTGKCSPSYREIMKCTGSSIGAISRAINQLVAAELIERFREGRRDKYEYILNR